IILVTYLISLFFWPTPAVPLVGALLIPVAIRAGLPAIGAALAISFAGQGMALSSDYIIQIAPTLTATAANADVTLLADRGFLLSIVTGLVSIVVAYLFIRKMIQKPSEEHLKKWEPQEVTEEAKNSKFSSLFAVLVPVAFLAT